MGIRVRAFCKSAVEYVIIVSLLILAVEGISRAVHRGVRPMLPHNQDDQLAPRMPPDLNTRLQFGAKAEFRVCSDRYGMRTSQCEASYESAAVIAAGDSQVLGWGIEQGQTFAALLAERCGAPGRARQMAVAGTDVERLSSWAGDFARVESGALPRPRLKLVAINLGNDLDEIYFGRSVVRLPWFKKISEWVNTHSFAMLDFLFMKAKLGTEWPMPPGANPVLFALSDRELDALSDAVAESAADLLLTLPPADRSAVLIIPNDYQVAVEQFDKYQRFYPSRESFDGWRLRAPVARAALQRAQARIVRTLRDRQVVVVEPNLALSAHPAEQVFDDSSHHLTVLGHKVIAESIFKELRL